MNNLYDYFEDIVCINLDISVDRRKHATEYFEKLDIPARFFITSKHKNGGMYGCFDSHVQILMDAYKRGLNNVLIFEDDFLPTASYSDENLKKAIDFMQMHEDWDIMHLGYLFIKDTKDGLSTIFDAHHHTPDIVQYNPFCTQALCYNKRAIKTIVETYHEYIGIVHFDMYISTFAGFKNYCIVPMLFDQNFYFQHNNESMDGMEYFLRLMFPLIATSQLNYRMSFIKFFMNKYKRYFFYFYMIIFSIILYCIKNSLILPLKKKI
jgi:GR25 family glycosyltransferase involved in LPS biosynthesis